MVARSERSDPASHAMIWMGAASPPSCGVAGVLGRHRSAISVSAWDGPSRRAAHGWSGLGVRSERYMCGCVRCAAESRRTAAARSGIIGLTIRDSSCRGIGWPSESGRYAAVSPRRSHSVPPSQTMIWIGAASPPSCGLGGVRGRQRSAISPSAWDGPLQRAAHAWPGSGVRSERDTCGRVRRAAESRRTAAARSGIFGWTIRDPSCLPLDGRRNSADKRPNLRGEAMRM